MYVIARVTTDAHIESPSVSSQGMQISDDTLRVSTPVSQKQIVMRCGSLIDTLAR